MGNIWVQDKADSKHGSKAFEMNKEELLFALRGRVNSGDRFVKNISAGDGWKLELPHGCPGRCGVGWGSGSNKVRA